MDLISFTGLGLTLDIPGVFIVHRVGEVVMSRSLNFNSLDQGWLNDGAVSMMIQWSWTQRVFYSNSSTDANYQETD